MRWSRIVAVTLGLLTAVFTLAACGFQGKPPAFTSTNAIGVTIQANGAAQPGGSAVFTQAYAGHYIVYLQGKEVPYHNPATPVELRQGSCTGPVIGAVTDNAPAMAQAPAMQAASNKGANVAIQPSADIYTVVLAQAGNPKATEFACGNPLSNQRQYFELWPAGAAESVGIGTVLSESIVATKVSLTLEAPATVKAPVSWSVRSGSCTGETLASGEFAAGSATATGYVFQPLTSGKWWLTLGPTGQQGSCAKVE